jgi:uncharacterized cupredoxin-like copper-binding protein
MLIVLSACGGGGKGGTVGVNVQEFAVIPGQTSVENGPVTFNVTNKGPDDKHEFVVFKTDLAPDALPTKQDGSVDEKGSGIEAIGEIEEFAVGQTKTVKFDLKEGKYVLICNVVETEQGKTIAHYQQGMRTAFTVTA